MRYAISAALSGLHIIGSIAQAQFGPPTAPITPWAMPTTAAADREQIGTCQSVPVYRDQIAVATEKSLNDELHRLLTREPMKKYYDEHKAALEPSDAEIEFTMKFFARKQQQMIERHSPELRKRLAQIEEELANQKLDEKQRKKLENEKSTITFKLTRLNNSQQEDANRSFVKWWLERWKLQRHLYDNFGSGRILWQQAGLEAYDAQRTWIESLEAKGEFTISDPELRGKLYAYWTRQPSPFLSDKPESIKEFLSPAWALPAKQD